MQPTCSEEGAILVQWEVTRRAFAQILGAFACSGSGIWNAVSDASSVFLLKIHPESAFLQTMYLGCVWKWIRSRGQNSAPENRRASLYSVKGIKISRLTRDCFLILWSLHRLLRCCRTDRKTDCRTFLFLGTQDIERGQLWCIQNPCLFITAPILSRDRVWNLFVCIWPKAREPTYCGERPDRPYIHTWSGRGNT